MKRKKKSTQKKVEEELWRLCREITFKKYGNTCYTCHSTNLTGSNLQLGHFIPRSTCGALLRYDLRNLRPQCMRCNIHGGGQGAEFYRQMVVEVGQEAVDIIFRDKQKSVKASDHYTKLLQQYREIS